MITIDLIFSQITELYSDYSKFTAHYSNDNFCCNYRAFIAKDGKWPYQYKLRFYCWVGLYVDCGLIFFHNMLFMHRDNKLFGKSVWQGLQRGLVSTSCESTKTYSFDDRTRSETILSLWFWNVYRLIGSIFKSKRLIHFI